MIHHTIDFYIASVSDLPVMDNEGERIQLDLHLSYLTNQEESSMACQSSGSAKHKQRAAGSG